MTLSKKDLPSSAICISQSDYMKMQNRSLLLSPAQEASLAAKAEAARAEKENVSLARKARMRKLEEDAKSKAVKSASEEISDLKKEAIRKAAREKIDQSNDLVKLLNTYSQRAMAFTIRDQQILDKGRREKVEGDYEKRLDVAMEIDRLKELKAREDSERSKRDKRLEDRSVIIDQIEARKKLKLLDEEAREQENRQMLQTIQKYKDEDQKAVERKEATIAKSRIEVINANTAAIEGKRKNKEREKEEVEMILAYQVSEGESGKTFVFKANQPIGATTQPNGIHITNNFSTSHSNPTSIIPSLLLPSVALPFPCNHVPLLSNPSCSRTRPSRT